MHSYLRSDLETIYLCTPADKQSHHDYNASLESWYQFARYSDSAKKIWSGKVASSDGLMSSPKTLNVASIDFSYFLSHLLIIVSLCHLGWRYFFAIRENVHSKRVLVRRWTLATTPKCSRYTQCNFSKSRSRKGFLVCSGSSFLDAHPRRIWQSLITWLVSSQVIPTKCAHFSGLCAVLHQHLSNIRITLADGRSICGM